MALIFFCNPRNYLSYNRHACLGAANDNGEGASNGWARSERARLAKSVNSLRGRRKALLASQSARHEAHCPSASSCSHPDTAATGPEQSTNPVETAALGGGKKRQRDQYDASDLREERTNLRGQNKSAGCTRGPGPVASPFVVTPHPQFKAIDKRWCAQSPNFDALVLRATPGACKDSWFARSIL